MQDYHALLPSGAQYMFPYMKKDNWLFNYAKMQGMERVFQGMARRSSFNSRMENAPLALQMDYRKYEEEFMEFFPQLIDFVKEKEMKKEEVFQRKGK